MFANEAVLRARVSGVATKKGIERVGEDVYKCLSMAVEDRLRGMLHRLVKLAKQVRPRGTLGCHPLRSSRGTSVGVDKRDVPRRSFVLEILHRLLKVLALKPVRSGPFTKG